MQFRQILISYQIRFFAKAYKSTYYIRYFDIIAPKSSKRSPNASKTSLLEYKHKQQTFKIEKDMNKKSKKCIKSNCGRKCNDSPKKHIEQLIEDCKLLGLDAIDTDKGAIPVEQLCKPDCPFKGDEWSTSSPSTRPAPTPTSSSASAASSAPAPMWASTSAHIWPNENKSVSLHPISFLIYQP